MIKIVNEILDFKAEEHQQADSIFIEKLKQALTNLIGEWIDELQDGFVNEMEDVVIFLRENVRILIETHAGQDMGPIMGAMGTESIMKYIISAYEKYKVQKEQLRRAKEAERATSKPEPEDVKMKPVEDEKEEEKAESLEVQRERLLMKYEEILNKDEEIQNEMKEQGPLSRAYLSICPFNKSSNKIAEE